MVKFVILPTCFLTFCINSLAIAGDDKNSDAGKIVNKNNETKSAVVRKNNSLKSIEKFLKENVDSHNSYINDLLSRIQNTRDALMCIVNKRRINKKDLKKEIDKFNNDVKEIVEKYNNIFTEPSSGSGIDTEALPEKSNPVKGHAIVTLDWRKRLRINCLYNPIQELTSPLTEENVIEFVNERKFSNELLETKDLPDSDVGCANVALSSPEKSIATIDDQKILN